MNVTDDENMAEISSGESMPVVDTQGSGGRMTGVFRDRDDRWNFVDYVLAVCGNMKGMSPDLESLRREMNDMILDF